MIAAFLLGRTARWRAHGEQMRRWSGHWLRGAWEYRDKTTEEIEIEEGLFIW
jgi:hypothetical protein